MIVMEQTPPENSPAPETVTIDPAIQQAIGTYFAKDYARIRPDIENAAANFPEIDGFPQGQTRITNGLTNADLVIQNLCAGTMPPIVQISSGNYEFPRDLPKPPNQLKDLEPGEWTLEKKQVAALFGAIASRFFNSLASIAGVFEMAGNEQIRDVIIDYSNTDNPLKRASYLHEGLKVVVDENRQVILTPSSEVPEE